MTAPINQQGGERVWRPGSGAVVALPWLFLLVVLLSTLRWREHPVMGWRSHLGREQDQAHADIEAAHIELARLHAARAFDRWGQ